MSQSEKIAKIKQEARIYYYNVRQALSLERRLEGSLACCDFLKGKLSNHTHIASFASKDSEINLWDFNLTLCAWGKLVLPKLVDNHLTLFRVTNIERDLVRSNLNIMEPNPDTCKKIETDSLDAIIVPGLSFDHQNNRLGYGKGHYDRLLALLDEKLKIGVCFKEQMAQNLPSLDHDIKVDTVFSF